MCRWCYRDAVVPGLFSPVRVPVAFNSAATLQPCAGSGSVGDAPRSTDEVQTRRIGGRPRHASRSLSPNCARGEASVGSPPPRRPEGRWRRAGFRRAPAEPAPAGSRPCTSARLHGSMMARGDLAEVAELDRKNDITFNHRLRIRRHDDIYT